VETIYILSTSLHIAGSEQLGKLQSESKRNFDGPAKAQTSGVISQHRWVVEVDFNGEVNLLNGTIWCAIFTCRWISKDFSCLLHSERLPGTGRQSEIRFD